jgi:hypothetical protein
MSPILRNLIIAALFVLPPGVAFAQPLPPNPVAVPMPPAGPPPVLPPQVPLQPPLPPTTPPPGPPPYALPTQLPPPSPNVPPAPSTGFPDLIPAGTGPFAPFGDRPMFFVGLDLDILKPVFLDNLHQTVTLPDGTSNTLHVPRAELPWTVSPEFQFGYRLPDNAGEFLLAYRFLVSDGSSSLSSDIGDFGVRTRLDMNIIDFDYNSGWLSPAPRWQWKWDVGARIAAIYYDTEVGNEFLYQSARNNFFGAGGHGGLQLERQLPVLPAFGFFGKIDGSVLIGKIDQHFNETTFDANGNLEGSILEQRKTQSVEELSFETGISYRPWNDETLRFELGYEYEHWFSLGNIDGSSASLSTQGVFLRGRLAF